MLCSSFNSQPPLGSRWTINLEGAVVEIPKIVIAKKGANLTRVMGWFNAKLRKAWKFVFPLTESNVTERSFPLTDAFGGRSQTRVGCYHLMVPLLEEEHQSVWETIPQISSNPTLCKVNPLKCLLERRMLETMPISTSFTSSKNSMKLIQIF